MLNGNLNSLEITIYDPLNLRDTIETISDVVRELNLDDGGPRNILSFLKIFFSGVYSEKKEFDDNILIIQKILSGNLPASKINPIKEHIFSGEWDGQLSANIQQIIQGICGSSEAEPFFSRLYNQASLRFFTEQELQSLQEAYTSQEYVRLVLEIVKHGFGNLESLPCFFAENIYQEALTYDFDSPLRFELMRIAAVKGNRNAALEYGNYVAKQERFSDAFEYLLLALPLPAAVWNIAFLIENNQVDIEMVRKFENVYRLNEKLNPKNFGEYRPELDAVFCTETDPKQYTKLITAYKTYFYLAHKEGFCKAFNSLAKLLGRRKLAVGENPVFSAEDLRKKYLARAIGASNIMATSNEASRLLEEHLVQPLSAEQEKYMLELIKSSMSVQMGRGFYNMARYCEHSGVPINKEELASMYERALALNVEGRGVRIDALLRLGRLSVDTSKKIDYFQKALDIGYPDAAFEIGCICYQEFIKTPKMHYLLKLNSVIDENISFMTESTREKALAMQAEANEYSQNITGKGGII